MEATYYVIRRAFFHFCTVKNTMRWTKLSLSGCYTTDMSIFRDERGTFFKTFNSSLIRELSANFQAREAFTTVSHKNVLRGMHYQGVPHDHEKVVFITKGRAHDVLVDLRSGADFGKVCSIEMKASETCTAVFVARGVAHGFLSLTGGCTMNYVTDCEHAPNFDFGVLWSSVNHIWPIKRPVVSQRDLRHPPISEVKINNF